MLRDVLSQLSRCRHDGSSASQRPDSARRVRPVEHGTIPAHVESNQKEARHTLYDAHVCTKKPRYSVPVSSNILPSTSRNQPTNCPQWTLQTNSVAHSVAANHSPPRETERCSILRPSLHFHNHMVVYSQPLSFASIPKLTISTRVRVTMHPRSSSCLVKPSRTTEPEPDTHFNPRVRVRRLPKMGSSLPASTKTHIQMSPRVQTRASGTSASLRGDIPSSLSCSCRITQNTTKN